MSTSVVTHIHDHTVSIDVHPLIDSEMGGRYVINVIVKDADSFVKSNEFSFFLHDSQSVGDKLIGLRDAIDDAITKYGLTSSVVDPHIKTIKALDAVFNEIVS